MPALNKTAWFCFHMFIVAQLIVHLSRLYTLHHILDAHFSNSGYKPGCIIASWRIWGETTVLKQSKKEKGMTFGLHYQEVQEIKGSISHLFSLYSCHAYQVNESSHFLWLPLRKNYTN